MRVVLLAAMVSCLIAWGVTKAIDCLSTHVHGVSQQIVWSLK